MTDLYFLIHVVNSQFFNSTSKLVMSTETLTKETNAEVQTQPVTVKMKKRKGSKQFKAIYSFFMSFVYEISSSIFYER